MHNEFLDLIPYLLIGLGIGYLVTLGVTGGQSDLDRCKENLEIQKTKIRMRSGKM